MLNLKQKEQEKKRNINTELIILALNIKNNSKKCKYSSGSGFKRNKNRKKNVYLHVGLKMFNFRSVFSLSPTTCFEVAARFVFAACGTCGVKL